MSSAARRSLLALLLVTTPAWVSSARLEDGDGAEMLAVSEANASSVAQGPHRPDRGPYRPRTPWFLWHPDGPTVNDVSCGKKVKTYSTAALAAIVKEQPELIKRAFPWQGVKTQWGFVIHRVRLVIDGVGVVVAVDEQVPVTSEGRFRFAGTNGNRHAWPVLLEKAFAKVFGSYWAIRKAESAVFMRAITGVPVVLREVEPKGKEGPWVNHHGPLTARAKRGSSADFQEAAVVGWKPDTREVALYDPKSGATTSESETSFKETFASTTEALAWWSVDNRRSRSVTVGKPVALQFTSKPGRFRVELEWWSELMASSFGCPTGEGEVTLLIGREGQHGAQPDHVPWRAGKQQSPTLWVVEGEEDEETTWLVYVYTLFENAVWLDTASLTVFHENKPVSLSWSDDALQVGREILGFPCVDIQHPDFEDVYVGLPIVVAGAPAWTLSKKEQVIWLDMEKNRLQLSPSRYRLEESDPNFDFGRLECSSSSREPPQYIPLPARGSPHQLCGFNVGDRVLYTVKDEEVCAEIEAITGNKEVRVRYNRVKTTTLSLECGEEDIVKRDECHPFQGGDWVTVNTRTRGLVRDRITQVNCWSMILKEEGEKTCGEAKGVVYYGNNCQFYYGETVLLWDQRFQRFDLGDVDHRENGRVWVSHDGQKKPFGCNDRLVKKVSRCTREGWAMVKRLKKLQDAEQIMASSRAKYPLEPGEDRLFPPDRDSLGPDPECGKFCDLFDRWGSISEVLAGVPRAF